MVLQIQHDQLRATDLDPARLRVVGHEANIILLAIKSFSDDGGASDGTSLDAVRRRLAAAAEPEGAAAVGGRRLDPAVVACMRSNAETCRRFEL